MFTLSHVAQGPRSVISPHPIHACACGCLSVFFLPSLYFFKSFFHLFLIPAMVPDENSMEDLLCNSSFGSMVSLDYVTPDTGYEPKDMELEPRDLQRYLLPEHPRGYSFLHQPRHRRLPSFLRSWSIERGNPLR